MSLSTKKAALNAQTGPRGSWAQLLNPISAITGGNDRIPQSLAETFPDNPERAWMVAKVGAVSILAAALAGGARWIQHMDRMHRLKDKNDPTADLKSQLNTTFTEPLGVDKKAAESGEYVVEMPSALNLFDSTKKTAIPLGAFLLAGSLSWELANRMSDKKRNHELKESIKEKDKVIQSLLATRARVAKGTATKAEVNQALAGADQVVSTKVASLEKCAADNVQLPRAVLAGAGLLALSVLTAATIGGYRHFSETDKNNIKYKALKQGIDRYTRAKTQMSPVTYVPSDASEFFKSIDRDQAPPDARNQPEITPAKKPISITL